MLRWDGGILVRVRLVGDGPWWRSSGCRLDLQRVASVAWHSVGDNGVGCGGLFGLFSPAVVVSSALSGALFVCEGVLFGT
jgi:hypothetical protein